VGRGGGGTVSKEGRKKIRPYSISSGRGKQRKEKFHESLRQSLGKQKTSLEKGGRLKQESVDWLWPCGQDEKRGKVDTGISDVATRKRGEKKIQKEDGERETTRMRIKIDI